MLKEIPRAIEVLIKKAAVDPAFKKMLLEERARAAEAIALTLSPAEEAMLEAVPEAQLRVIVANTKVSPGLRPAFLGATAGVMLAAIGTTVITRASGSAANISFGITPGNMPPRDSTPPGSPADWNLEPEYSVVYGRVLDSNNRPVKGAQVTVSTLEGDKSGSTDANGEFLIEGVRLGCWPVNAARAGYATRTLEDIYVLKDYRTSLTFVLIETDKSVPYKPGVDGIRPDRP